MLCSVLHIMSHPGCRHSAETDVDRWGDGGRLLHGGEEAAGEELRLHGGHLQSGATIYVEERPSPQHESCYWILPLDTVRETEMHCFTYFPRLGLFWMRLLGNTWLESPAKKLDSQLGLLLASLLPSSCSFFFLHSGFSHS